MLFLCSWNLFAQLSSLVPPCSHKPHQKLSVKRHKCCNSTAYIFLNVLLSLLSSVLSLQMKSKPTFLILYTIEALFSTLALLPLLTFNITTPFSQSKFSAFSLSSTVLPQNSVWCFCDMEQKYLVQKLQKKLKQSPFSSYKLNTRAMYDCYIKTKQLDTGE